MAFNKIDANGEEMMREALKKAGQFFSYLNLTGNSDEEDEEKEELVVNGHDIKKYYPENDAKD